MCIQVALGAGADYEYWGSATKACRGCRLNLGDVILFVYVLCTAVINILVQLQSNTLYSC